MQRNTILLLMLAIVPLSGCLGFGDDPATPVETPTDCPDAHAQDEAVETQEEEASLEDLNVTLLESRETAQANGTVEDSHDECPGGQIPAHNELPVAMLSMTDSQGNPVNGSAILTGETITFSANGTSDSDGSIDLIGLTVTDGNGTRNVALYDEGAFMDATLTFSHAGMVNVTMRVLDNRGEGTLLSDVAYVNGFETGSQDMVLFDPSATGCNPTLHEDQAGLIGNMFRIKDTVNVQSGVQWISVEATGTRAVTICTADADSMATGETGASTTDDPASSMAPSPQYFVALYPSAPDTTVTWTTVLHYEPA